jgi:ribonuclease VapC
VIIVVDTSAVIAMMAEEAEAETFYGAMATASQRLMSSVIYYEAATVMLKRYGREGVADLRDFADRSAIELKDFTWEILTLAIDAYARYGKGMGHRPFLNLGDCISYALAKSLDAPLLFKGDDFAATDIKSCL